jgi:hypothetical protein
MKLTDLDDSDKIVTKEYLELKLAELKLEIQKEFKQARHELADQFKWSVGLIFGLYGMIAIGYFIK